MKIKHHWTLSNLVLTKLKKGQRLNQQGFLKEGSWRLAAIIHDLKRRKKVCISKASLAGRAVEYYLDAEELSRLRSQDNSNNCSPKQ